MNIVRNINTPEYWDDVYKREWESKQVLGDKYHRDYGPIHESLIRLIPPASRVLDIACGPGVLCRKIKMHLSDASVTGVDFSSYTIARSTERDRDLGVQYRCLDIRTSLCSLQREFDVVIMCEVIEHLDNPAAVIRDAVALLKKNGLFIVSCPHANEIPDAEHVAEWDHESLFHLLSPYSSTITFTRFSPPYYHYWMMAHLRKEFS
jgi:2-polyprenyl-3-methyl-5-hydroxy-6-metoxy-1,4-benzoquinol methylase